MKNQAMLFLSKNSRRHLSRPHDGSICCLVFHGNTTATCWLLLGLLAFLGGCSCSRDSDRTEDSTPSNQEADSPQASTENQKTSTSTNPPGESRKQGKSPTGNNEPPNKTPPGSASSQMGVGSPRPQAASRPDGDTTNGPPPSLSPQQAKQLADRHLAKAKKAAQRGKYQEAFEDTLVAWQATRQHAGDTICQELTDEAIALLEKYGEAANASAGGGALGGSRRKPLRVE